MLWFVSGNDPERLAGELTRKINRLRSPFEAEKILLDNPLKYPYIQNQLARGLGISSGIKIVPPGNFLWSVLSECFPDAPVNNPLSKIGISFSLVEIFSRMDEASDPIALPGGIPFPLDSSSRWTLATTLGEIFDRILIYRPDWISAWESGSHSGDPWARLWLFLVRKTPSHRVSLLKRFSRLVRDSPDSLREKTFLKTPVHVIGQSLLPPSFLDFLKDLSLLTDVVIYQWQATQVYLFPGFQPSLPGDLQATAANPLTRAMGSQFIRMRELCIQRSDQSEEVFSVPEEKSLLSRIQAGIINDRKALSLEASGPDPSVRIFLARTPIGEVQALYQHLVSAFSRDSTLMASDVLVMVSDLDLFAPFIDAVFQEKNAAGGSFPYRIVGKGRSAAFKYIENCAKVVRGKCSASEVMALLDHPLSRERFGLDAQEVEMIERWVSRLPVWWGLSPEMRESFGASELDLNTFAWGVERLLLSFSFITPLPVGKMIAFDGGDLWEVAPVLERFLGFLKILVELGRRLPDEECGCFWGETVLWMAGHLFPHDFSAKEPETASSMISLSRMLAPAGHEDEIRRMSLIRIPFEGFLQMLESQISGEPSGGSSPGITFAPMVSARGIPSRLIALLGMSSDLVALKDRVVPYDPLMSAPRAGDHSRREDDQGIFLEALLSCRDSIFISYSGTGQESPGEVLPASPLGHLLDLIRANTANRDQAVTEIRSLVEGFSPKRRSSEHCGFPAFPIPDEMNQVIPAIFPDQIDLDEVRSFIRDPARFFWSSRSGGALRNTISELPSSDPFVLDYMNAKTIGKKIFSYMEEKAGETPSVKVVAPFGLLPHGSGGLSIFETLSGSISRLWKEKEKFLSQDRATKRPLQELSLSLIPGMIGESFSLCGKIRGQVFLGDDQVNHAVFLPHFHSRKDLMSLWLDHLLLSVCFIEKKVVSTIYSLSGSGRESYSVKEDQKRLLHDIFSLFCHASMTPVPIFLKSAWKYAQCWVKYRKKAPGESPYPWGDINGADRRNALEQAFTTWLAERRNPDIAPEESLLYASAPPWSLQTALSRGELLPSEKLSLRIFPPILGAVADEKKGNDKS